ncbi:MAG: Wzz/FepE/Etk N-terminal domain-containing protein [Pseudomonadota bacterium]|nr:Wzz/FepE/Etk N-terminal domain-containing protein [Pseudomonadota bacterium]
MTTSQRNEPPHTSTTNIATAYDDQLKDRSLADVIKVIWRQKILISAATIILTAAAAVLTQVADEKYRASIVLSPVSDDSSGGRLGGLASLASQISGLGSLGFAGPGSAQKAESIAVLQSEALTERYIKENDLLPVLYDSKWDAVKHTWKSGASDEIPTLWKANQYFRRHIRNVSTDSKTGLTTLTIVWKDPREAARWANGIVSMTNDYLRGRAIEDSERNIGYLKDQFTKTNIIGVQSAINSILENEMKKAMLAQGSREYALKVIDPAVPPEKRSSPIPVLWISLGFLLGFGGSIFAVFITYFRPIRVYLKQDAPRQ